MISRRGLLRALPALIAMPAIVRVGSLMILPPRPRRELIAWITSGFGGMAAPVYAPAGYGAALIRHTVDVLTFGTAMIQYAPGGLTIGPWQRAPVPVSREWPSGLTPDTIVGVTQLYPHP